MAKIKDGGWLNVENEQKTVTIGTASNEVEKKTTKKKIVEKVKEEKAQLNN